MPTENKPAEPFQREDRYIVIKRSDMDKLPADVRRNFSGRCRKFYEQMLIAGAPARSFLVVESDWPEYEPAWKMIERRMTGQPAVTAAEELEAVLHWRNKHVIAVRERDALQERLNAADQRIDELERGHGQQVAYVLTRDGDVCYEADDGIVISNTPGDETDLYKWRPVYFGITGSPAEVAQKLIKH